MKYRFRNLVHYSVLFLILFSLESIAEIVRGHLHKQENSYTVELLTGETFQLSINNKYLFELPTLTHEFLINNLKNGISVDTKLPLNFPEYTLYFDGERNGNTFIAKRTPMFSTGEETITGVLQINNKDEFFIDGKLIEFDTTYAVNGVATDINSVKSFVGKRIRATVKAFEEKLIMTALVPADLYSAADISEIKSKTLQMSKADIKSKVNDFALRLVYSDAISKSQLSFRETILDKNISKVKPGDKGLIITLSGRQGDDTGALAGHFAVGEVTVTENMDLDIEIWNFYNVPNEKKILAGFTNFVDYFGNFTSGQNNFRPTYSMILYGISPDILSKIRDQLGVEYAHLRQSTKGFGIYFNCTTTSVDGLRNVGFQGKSYSSAFTNTLKSVFGDAVSFWGPTYSTLAKSSDQTKDTIQSLAYLLSSDPNRYFPRAAFNGYLENIESIAERFNIERVDYIFHAQTPSKRLMGGAPSGSLLRVNKGKNLDLAIKNNTSDERAKVQQAIDDLMRP